MFDYSHLKNLTFLPYIGFHIVRHSNEDNIGNGIALHHHDEAKQKQKNDFLMKARDLSSRLHKGIVKCFIKNKKYEE